MNAPGSSMSKSPDGWRTWIRFSTSACTSRLRSTNPARVAPACAGRPKTGPESAPDSVGFAAVPAGLGRRLRREGTIEDLLKTFCRFCQHVRSVFARKPVPARRAFVSFVSDLQEHIQRFRDARTLSRGTRRRPAFTSHFKRIQHATQRANAIWIRRGDLCWRCCQEVTCMD